MTGARDRQKRDRRGGRPGATLGLLDRVKHTKHLFRIKGEEWFEQMACSSDTVQNAGQHAATMVRKKAGVNKTWSGMSRPRDTGKFGLVQNNTDIVDWSGGIRRAALPQKRGCRSQRTNETITNT